MQRFSKFCSFDAELTRCSGSRGRHHAVTPAFISAVLFILGQKLLGVPGPNEVLGEGATLPVIEHSWFNV